MAALAEKWCELVFLFSVYRRYRHHRHDGDVRPPARPAGLAVRCGSDDLRPLGLVVVSSRWRRAFAPAGDGCFDPDRRRVLRHHRALAWSRVSEPGAGAPG